MKPSNDSRPINSVSGSFLAETEHGAYEIKPGVDHVVVDGTVLPLTIDALGDNYYQLILDGRRVTFAAQQADSGEYVVTINNRETLVKVQDERDLILAKYGNESRRATADGNVFAPMPGLVLRVLVEEGQHVERGMPLLVLEAMKMENELAAPASGTVRRIHATIGDAVGKSQLLLELQAYRHEDGD